MVLINTGIMHRIFTPLKVFSMTPSTGQNTLQIFVHTTNTRDETLTLGTSNNKKLVRIGMTTNFFCKNGNEWEIDGTTLSVLPYP